MVIILISVLAGLLLMAVRGGMFRGKTAAIVSEIEQLSTAFETYRSERGAYPPTTGFFIGDPGGTKNQPRIQRHIAKAFPRYVGGYSTGNPNFRDDVAIATQYVVNNSTTIPPALQYKSSYSFAKGYGLDVNNLDPAEAIVFWLGGLPDPSAETKLAGFHLDPASPFVPAIVRSTNGYLGKDAMGNPINPIESFGPSAQGQRTPRTFPFDPRRLVDYDQDGWWEYLPVSGSMESNTPPYVYFDSGSYPLGPAYPYPKAAGGTLPDGQGPQSLASQWGNTIPYAADPPPPPPPVKFVNSQKFQIIAAGPDNQYDVELTTSTINSTGNPWWFRPEYFPSGTNYEDRGRDNLTNFAKGPLGDEIPQ